MGMRSLLGKVVVLACAALSCGGIAQDFNEDWLLLRMPRAVSEESLVGRYFFNGQFHYASPSSVPTEIEVVDSGATLTGKIRESVGGSLSTNIKDVLTADLTQSSVSIRDVTLSGLTIHEPKSFYALDFVPATFPRRLVTGLLVAEKFDISFSEDVTGQAQAEVERAIGEILPVKGKVTFAANQAVVHTGSKLAVAIQLVSVLRGSPRNFIHQNVLTDTNERLLAQGPVRSPNDYIASVRQLTDEELQEKGLDIEADTYCMRVEVKRVGADANHIRQWCPRYGHIKNIADASDDYEPNPKDDFSDQIDLPSLAFSSGSLGRAGLIQTFLTLSAVSVEVSPINPKKLAQISLHISLKENRISLAKCPLYGYPMYPDICL